MIKRAVMVTLHFILGGWVVGCVVLHAGFIRLQGPRRPVIQQVCVPRGPPCSKQENQSSLAPLIPRNKANHLQRDSNCFLPQGGKTVKLDRCRIRVSDVISCNTSVLIVSGNPARTLESKADRWVIYRLSRRGSKCNNDFTNKDIKYQQSHWGKEQTYCIVTLTCFYHYYSYCACDP